METLFSALQEDEIEGVTLAQGMQVTNDLDLPRVVVAHINDPTGRPYMVQENGWWMFRGAQLALDDNCDFVKVYLPARSTARVLRYGYIDGVVKPGWGCQYQLALGEIEREGGVSRCAVKVFSVTPNLFAPRVEFLQPIAEARVNGEPWYYLDGTLLFLPNRPDTYRVEVRHGEAETPSLIRTFARVESCRWQDSTLIFQALLPLWCRELHPQLLFTAALFTRGHTPREVRGGRILEKSTVGAIIEFVPGEVIVVFDQ